MIAPTRTGDTGYTLLRDLDAFYADHRPCGDLHTGLTPSEPERVWLACSCGARMERPIQVG